MKERRITVVRKIEIVLLIVIVAFAGFPFAAGDGIGAAGTSTSGTFESGAGWTYDSSSHKLTISGTGGMDVYPSSEVTPWAAFAGEITTIVVENGISSIGKCAFANLNALTEMTVADSVNNISDDALDGSTDNLVIYGSFGMKAEDFAAGKGIRFLPVNITDLSDAVLTLTSENYTYNGSACKPSVNVKKSLTTLKEGEDYTVSYSDNTKVGTASVAITGQGKFKGSKEREFTISAASVAGASVTGLASRQYTGSAIEQAPSAVTVDGNMLVAGTDYTLTWNNNTNAGTASVIITGMGNYTGSVTKTFEIVKATNQMTVEGKTVSVKYAKLKNKKKTIRVKSVLKLSGNQGIVTFKKVSGNKKITINKKTGKVTIKKGIRKGTYKIKSK